MSIAEFFESGEMKEHKGAFRNLVMIARADGVISDVEQAILDRMARRLDLTEQQVKEIMDNPSSFPMSPPNNIQDRRERMVDLVRLANADLLVDESEMKVMEKCAIGLGYHTEDIPEMVNRILGFLKEGKNRSEVIEAMLQTN